MNAREAREQAVRQGYLRGAAARRAGLDYTAGIGTMDSEHGKHATSFRKGYASGWFSEAPSPEAPASHPFEAVPGCECDYCREQRAQVTTEYQWDDGRWYPEPQCDCDEEYGPCEQHGETVAQREGASHRTADELALVYCSDVADIIGARAEGSARADERARLCEVLNAAADPTSGCAWFANPDDADAAWDLVREYEGLAADAGFGTWWDDGYRIVRITGGPLA